MVRSLVLSVAVLAIPAAFASEIRNPQINFVTFTQDLADVAQRRDSRVITEAQFLRMAAEPGTVLLDARSERLYRLRHVKGAVNLSFPDFTKETLARIIPTKETRILIYCNNNFVDLPDSMPVKAPAAALNMSTFLSLHSYGYRNVYELGPALSVVTTKLAFAGEETRPR